MQTRFADHPNLRFFVGDVRNRSRLTRAMQGADIVVHAAAMKQVPACEYNPFEAVQTNVLGLAARRRRRHRHRRVEQVVALSTDKAVNPVNLYGATKLCEEKIIVQGNAYAAALEHGALAASATATSSAPAARSCRCSARRSPRVASPSPTSA